MVKNWLIRTKNNHILGPLSKDKVRELYYSKSIKDEDEICSGNGYWFYVKEKELIEKYLVGEDVQTFNIVSEAESVLTQDLPILPEVDVLPDSIEQSSEEELDIHPENDDLEYPDMEQVDQIEDTKPMSVDLSTDEQEAVPPLNKPKKKNDFLLYLLALIFLAMAIIAFLNRKKIISQFISKVSFVSKVYAQEIKPQKFVKKKSEELR